MTDPEFCTTESARKRHLSVDLKPVIRDGAYGRAGSTLCGAYGHDQAFQNRTQSWRRTQRIIAEMPPCLQCAKKARNLL